MELTIIEGGRDWDDPFQPLPFSLEHQPQRPGEICESVRLDWPQEQLDVARGTAAAARLPVALWLTITIESERALACVTAELDVERERIVATADGAASGRQTPAIRPPAARRLGEYGSALRTGHQRFAESERRAPILRVSHAVLASWSLAAAAAGRSLEEWILLCELVSGRQLWEAAAAENGQQLEGWLLVQAARVARSRST
ncbi:MAG TPA: hypothetical protein VGK62_05085 [Gaiellaceae bacterium]